MANTLTARYVLPIRNRYSDFRVYLTEVENGIFVATCLWWEGGRMMRAPTESRSITAHTEKRIASTPEDALRDIMTWARTQFGDDLGELRPE